MFERIGKNITLTSEGNTLIPYATNILSLSVNMKEAMTPSENSHGSITIGAASSLCIYRLPTIIKSFRNRHPNIDIYLKLLNCDQFVPMLSDNSIDIAFTIGDRLDGESIISKFEYPEPIMILASPKHTLASKTSLRKIDFENESFLLTELGCCYRRAFEKDLADSGIEVMVVLETGSIQAIKQTAMSDLGICVLPQIAVLEDIESQKLVPLAYEHDYGIVSQLIYHKDKWISPILTEFITEAEKRWEKAV